jgi:hypothetical protein
MNTSEIAMVGGTQPGMAFMPVNLMPIETPAILRKSA